MVRLVGSQLLEQQAMWFLALMIALDGGSMAIV
jgi:hypothetical protein